MIQKFKISIESRNKRPFAQIENKINEIIDFVNSKPKPILLITLIENTSQQDVEQINRSLLDDKELSKYKILTIKGKENSVKILNPEDLTDVEKRQIKLISNNILNGTKL